MEICMKRKNITLMFAINILFLSATCSGMDMVKTHMMNASTWTSNFFRSCWNIGILATLYATAGIYDFKKISGLDENKLSTYKIYELEKARDRVDAMNKYTLKESALTPLNNFSLKIQGAIQQKQDDEKAALEEAKLREEFGVSYDKAATIADIEKMIEEKKKQKK
jgi:hypothetical protein